MSSLLYMVKTHAAGHRAPGRENEGGNERAGADAGDEIEFRPISGFAPSGEEAGAKRSVFCPS
jgi:hypothetical protein